MSENMNPTKQKILVAASELFFNSTFDQVTVADIAKKAGISKGSVFNYFTSKEELGITIIAVYFQQYKMEMDQLKQQIDPKNPANVKEVFLSMIEKTLHDIADMPGFTIFLLQMLSTVNYGKSKNATKMTVAATEMVKNQILPIYTSMGEMLAGYGVSNPLIKGRLLGALFDGLAFLFYIEHIKRGDPLIKELANEVFHLFFEDN